MQLTPQQKVRLGLFVVAASIILVASALTLAGTRLFESRMLLFTRFTESVNGLERNAPVKYQGLRIGRVEDLYVAADAPETIEVVLAIDPRAILYEGTKAQLDQSGLTGIKSINLTPGNVRKAQLKPGARLPSSGSFLDQITDNAGAIVNDVRRVADQISLFINPENRARFEVMIAKIDSFVGHLDDWVVKEGAHIGSAVAQVGRAANQVESAAQKVAETLKASHNAVDTIKDETQATLRAWQKPVAGVDGKELAQAIKAVRQAADGATQRLSQGEAGRAIQAVAGTMQRVDRLLSDLDMVVRAGREDVTKTLSTLRQAAEDLREFSRILAQNPSVLVRGRNESAD